MDLDSIMDYKIDSAINKAMQHLTIQSRWYGDEKTNEFGIEIALFYKGCVVAIDRLDFFENQRK